MDMLKSVHIEGFKSIRDATIDLGPLTVLIGANGSGKSNFVSFLRMMQAIAEGRLQEFVGRAGGSRALVHFGPEGAATSAELALGLDDGMCRYSLGLVRSGPDSFAFVGERLATVSDRGTEATVQDVRDPAGHRESLTLQDPSESPRADDVRRFLLNSSAYHLTDTSGGAAVRSQGYIHDNHTLRHDAGNLAAYLYMLRETRRPYYDRIISAFRMAAPFFDDFVLAPMELNPENIRLDWRETGHDQLFGPHQLSDGSLRTIALLTLLLQPEDRLPSLIVIDEPELGLHPYVINMVGDLLRAVSNVCQVIVATQSTPMVNLFDPEEIVVVERDDQGGSSFRRLTSEGLSVWLEDYSVGQLWEMNVIGGRP